MAKNRTRVADKAAGSFVPMNRGLQLKPKGFGAAVVPGIQAKGAGVDLSRVAMRGMGLPVQAKLTVGAPNDKYEQEADAVAAKVVDRINSPQPQQASPGATGAVQRQAETDEDEKVATKPLAEGIQRQDLSGEEDKADMKPLAEGIQRQNDSGDEELQEEPLENAVQREAEPAAPEEEQEEQPGVMAKHLPDVQRQEDPDEDKGETEPLADGIQRRESSEDELNQKPLEGTAQRDDVPAPAEEEKEQPGVMAKYLPDVQREAMPEEEEAAVQSKSLVQQKAGGAMAASQQVESGIAGARGGGQALDEGTRGKMEGAFGADFGGVRVHTDERSDQLNRSLQSRAFATGQDIFFKRGEFNPGSRGGQELLAHELTHVVQQSHAQTSMQLKIANRTIPSSCIQLKPEITVKSGTTAELKSELKRLELEKLKLNIQDPLNKKYDAIIQKIKLRISNRGNSKRKDASVSLLFDGSNIFINGLGKSFPAVSGKLKGKKFDYSKNRQKLESIGGLPEGKYWITLSELRSSWKEEKLSWVDFSTNSRYDRFLRAWGSHRITIHPFDNTHTFGRGGFFIHGGAVAGSAGCIDLTSNMSKFVKALQSASNSAEKIILEVKYPAK